MVDRVETIAMRQNHSISLFIHLQSLYGYHLLNSYLTSFLIVIISYGTFFFHVNDFAERMMVSLTALLVLTALFTEANENSIQTPYLKLIDVWYAALIIFSFLAVGAITILNMMQHALVQRQDSSQLHDCTEATVRIFKRHNIIALIILTIMLVIFLLFYFLSAIDVI